MGRATSSSSTSASTRTACRPWPSPPRGTQVERARRRPFIYHTRTGYSDSQLDVTAIYYWAWGHRHLYRHRRRFLPLRLRRHFLHGLHRLRLQHPFHFRLRLRLFTRCSPVPVFSTLRTFYCRMAGLGKPAFSVYARRIKPTSGLDPTPGLASALDTTTPGLASGLDTPPSPIGHPGPNDIGLDPGPHRLLASIPAPLAAPHLQPQQQDSLKTRGRARFFRAYSAPSSDAPIGRHSLVVLQPLCPCPPLLLTSCGAPTSVAPPVAHPQELECQPATPQP